MHQNCIAQDEFLDYEKEKYYWLEIENVSILKSFFFLFLVEDTH